MPELKFNLERYLSIGAMVVALGATLYSAMHNQTALEYLTKADFNAFQIENVKKMTSLEGAVQNGFVGVSQQLASLNFVGTKDFQEFKDKSTANQFELQKQIEFLRRDLEIIDRTLSINTAKVAAIEQRIAILEALKTHVQ